MYQVYNVMRLPLALKLGKEMEQGAKDIGIAEGVEDVSASCKTTVEPRATSVSGTIPEGGGAWATRAVEQTAINAKAAQDALDKYPSIGDNGNWILWDVSAGKWVDSEISAATVSEEDIALAVDQYMQDHPFDGVTQDELAESVNAALLEAKKSGVFDGAPGAKGDKGDKGDAGATGAAGKDGAKGADGWWGDTLYKSLLASNVWTPEAYPQGWEEVTS